MTFETKCPNCTHTLRFMFPYDVDLCRSITTVVCSKCGKHSTVKFIASPETLQLEGIYDFSGDK